MGKDHTLFALTDGRVDFRTKANGRTYISIVPTAQTVPAAREAMKAAE
jgi:large subunit ribosomal protein L27